VDGSREGGGPDDTPPLLPPPPQGPAAATAAAAAGGGDRYDKSRGACRATLLGHGGCIRIRGGGGVR
jgi:hypothetical protein